jgi:hypothetical protein
LIPLPGPGRDAAAKCRSAVGQACPIIRASLTGGCGRLRRAGARRAARDRLDGPQAQRRDARRPHSPGGAHRAARGSWSYQPRDRRRALPESPHRRVAPAQGLHEARDQLAQGAPRPAAARRARPGSGVGTPHRLAALGLEPPGCGTRGFAGAIRGGGVQSRSGHRVRGGRS